MPLLLCPNDNSSMQTIQRSGVELDVCPTCRGVWLDRGELEKLLGGAREDQADDRRERERFAAEADSFRRDPGDWSRRHPYDHDRGRYRDDDDHHRYGHGYGHHKKKRSSLLDFFD